MPVIFDGGDLDNQGWWRGGEICCLECHEETVLRATDNQGEPALMFDCCLMEAA